MAFHTTCNLFLVNMFSRFTLVNILWGKETPMIKNCFLQTKHWHHLTVYYMDLWPPFLLTLFSSLYNISSLPLLLKSSFQNDSVAALRFCNVSPWPTEIIALGTGSPSLPDRPLTSPLTFILYAPVTSSCL